MQKSPAKPWELQRTVSAPEARRASGSSTAASSGAGYAPSVPARSYGQHHASSVVDRYDRYSSPYASPYSSYGSYSRPYSSYSSYGAGYRSSPYARRPYGGYGYGGDMYGRRMFDEDPQHAGEGGGWMTTVQRSLQGVGQFSQLLDGSVFSMHESFMSIMEFVHTVGRLNTHVYTIVKAVGALLFLRATAPSIRQWLFPGSERDRDLASFRDFAGNSSRAADRSMPLHRILLLVGLLVVFGPYLLRRIFGGSRKPAKKIPQRKVVAVYDYKADSEEELSLRAGELIVVEDDRSNADWWMGVDEHGSRGFFPSAFCETLLDEEEDELDDDDDDDDDDVAAAAEDEDEEDGEAAGKTKEELAAKRALRKRCKEVVRERRRRDREFNSSGSAMRDRSGMGGMRGGPMDPIRRLAGSAARVEGRGLRAAEMMEDDDYQTTTNKRLSYSSHGY